MKLKVLLPTEIKIQREISKITVEGENGFFCMEPRHVDFTSALVPGILTFTETDGTEQFMAVDEGILVKCGDEVLAAVRNAAIGPDIADLRTVIAEEFKNLDDREKKARSASARLEAGLVRRFLDLERRGA